MKELSLIISVLFLLLCAGCEPRQDVFGEDTLASPYFEGSILEYLRSDPYNFDWTVELIERAGLTDLFEGEVDTLPEITFLAFTKMSVMRYVYDLKKDSVAQLGVEECRDLVLRHVLKGKVMKEDIAYRDMSYQIQDEKQTGGTDLVTLGGGNLRFFLTVEDYKGVPKGGPVHMQIFSLTAGASVPTATVGILPWHGVVHTLNYTYVLGRI